MAKVEALIRELDEFEYDYLPAKFITVFTNYPATVYTHKFDALDVDALTAECWKRGFKIWVFDNGHNEF